MPAERLHDVIIAGLGAMGSATALELSRRGVDVLGFDRYTPPHAFGSSHGETRIIREAYFEHPVYVPMVQRAYELWHALEQSAGVTLLRETGGLMIGRPDSALVQGARLSAQTHRLPHEALGAAEITARFPALRPERDMVAVWEPRAGILFPEACISAQLALARQRGAELHDGEAVEHWEPEGDDVRVSTSQSEYRARRLIITAGAWVASLLPGLPLPLRIERQALHWFECASDSFDAEHCPIHLWQFDGHRFFYGFPALDGAVKAGFHHEGETTTADGVRREVARGRNRCRARRDAALHPGRRRATAQVGGLLLHQYPRRPFLDRPSPGASAGADRQSVLRAWVQVCAGHRRDSGRPCSGQGAAVRAATLPTALSELQCVLSVWQSSRRCPGEAVQELLDNQMARSLLVANQWR